MTLGLVGWVQAAAILIFHGVLHKVRDTNQPFSVKDATNNSLAKSPRRSARNWEKMCKVPLFSFGVVSILTDIGLPATSQ